MEKIRRPPQAQLLHVEISSVWLQRDGRAGGPAEVQPGGTGAGTNEADIATDDHTNAAELVPAPGSMYAVK